MVTIRDVEAVDELKGRFDLGDQIRLSKGPCSVSDAVLSSEIDIWLSSGLFTEELVQFGCAAVSEKNGARLGIQALDMPHPIIFFIGAGKLMFFYRAIQIFLAGGGCHQTHLRMSPHDLPIKIITGSRFLKEGSLFPEGLKTLGTLFIHLI